MRTGGGVLPDTRRTGTFKQISLSCARTSATSIMFLLLTKFSLHQS